MEEEKKSRSKKSVSLKTINILMVLTAVVIIIVLLVIVFNVQRRYNILRENTRVLIECQRRAPELNEASDYLTQQVRSFAVTGKIEYINNYFSEVDVNRRRHKTLEYLEPYMEGTSAITYMKAALATSNELMDIEYYSMVLESIASGIGIEALPEEVQEFKLTAEDEALSNEEKHQKAILMLFDDNYQSYKDTIKQNVDNCLDVIETHLEEEQDQSYESLTRLLVLLFIMIIIMLVVVLAIIFISLELVMRPLVKAADYIKEQQKVPVKGSSEMQFLAEAYNDAFDKTQKKHNDLQKQALNDALTGLFNRAGYEQIIEDLNEEALCLLLVDVDKFKGVNDQYGHDVGDLVLKKAANVLKHQFRADDLIFRFGGDEFAVIMRNSGPQLQDLIKIKVGNANRQLGMEDNLPSVSFSVGAAFGTGTVTDDLFKEADNALYKVKKEGGCGVSFDGSPNE